MAEYTVNPKLDAAINDMLDQITDVGEDGVPVFGLLDRCRILDRALTLEKIKKGMASGRAGSAFDDDPPLDDPEEPLADDLPTDE